MPKKKEKKTIQDLLKSTQTLLIVFVALLILVITLLVLCVVKYKESKNDGFANMVVPIYETNTNYEFSINAKILSETDEYIIKVTNFRKDQINKEEFSYKIEINNETNSTIKVTKDDSKKDLMKDQANTVIEGRTLKKDKKDSVYYHVKITNYKDLSQDDSIYIKIVN